MIKEIDSTPNVIGKTCKSSILGQLKSISNPAKAYCKYCRTEISSNRDSYKDHEKGKKHSSFVIEAPKIIKITESVANLAPLQVAELKTCAFVCEQNQAILSLDKLINLFNNLFADSKIAQKFSCKRTKGTLIIKKVLGKSIFQDLVETITVKVSIFRQHRTVALPLLYRTDSSPSVKVKEGQIRKAMVQCDNGNATVRQRYAHGNTEKTKLSL